MQFRSRGQKIFNVINYILVILVCLTCLLPIVNTLAISFSAPTYVAAGQVYFWPKGFTTQSYEFAMSNGKFVRSFLIAVERCILGVALNLFCMITTAYPLSKDTKKFPDRNFFMFFYVFTMLFGGGLVPWYILMSNLHLLNSIWALVLPCAVSAYNIILMMNFFKGIPSALEEAALVDGAGPWRTLFQIYIPLSKPSIATITLFTVVYHWNNFYDGLVLMSKPNHYPLQTYIYQLTVTVDVRTITNIDTLKELLKVSGLTLNASKLVVSMVPILLVYPFLQRYFVTGLTLGSVKE